MSIPIHYTNGAIADLNKLVLYSAAAQTVVALFFNLAGESVAGATLTTGSTVKSIEVLYEASSGNPTWSSEFASVLFLSSNGTLSYNWSGNGVKATDNGYDTTRPSPATYGISITQAGLVASGPRAVGRVNL